MVLLIFASFSGFFADITLKERLFHFYDVFAAAASALLRDLSSHFASVSLPLRCRFSMLFQPESITDFFISSTLSSLIRLTFSFHFIFTLSFDFIFH